MKEKLTQLYCIVITTLFPLYIDHSYFNILEAKTNFFYITTLIYLFGMLAIIMTPYLLSSDDSILKIEITKDSLIYLFVFLLASITIISTLCSNDINASIHGTSGKLFGTFLLLLCCAMFLCITCTKGKSNIIVYSSMVSSIVVSVLAILNKFHIDPLNVYKQIPPSYQSTYLSTIGNVNILAGHLTIFFSLFIGLCFVTQEKVKKLLYSITSYLLLLAGICSISDSFLLSVVVVFLVLFYCSIKNTELINSYKILVIILVLAQISLAITSYICSFEVTWPTLHRLLLSPIFIITESILFLVFFVGVNYFVKKNRPLQKIFLTILCSIAILLLLLVLYANTSYDTSNLSWLLQYFRFTDEWGSSRGYIWSRTVRTFFSLPIKQLLFGVGPGQFYHFFSAYAEEAHTLFQTSIVDAHNEFLQFLVTTGILGTIGYFGMILCGIRAALQCNDKERIIIPTIFIAYLTQGMLNNPLVFTTPYIFLLAGITIARSRGYKTKEA